MTDGTDVEARLEALKTKYASKLGDRVAEITPYWERLSVRQDTTISLDDMITLVHKLAGSAGMYGHNRLGDAAGRLEAALETGAFEGFIGDSALRAEIDVMVAALTAEIV
jgi:HPt (histidine-containing phosphotransfer) domain-containing protein